MITKTCLVCGKQFECEQRREDKAKFCGYECYWKDKSKSQPEHLKTKGFQKGSQINLGRKRPDVTERNKKAITAFGNVIKHRIEHGKFIHNKYVWVLNPTHPAANKQGYVREHRLVMEQKLGRYLTGIEIVHHIDGNRLNNDINNLKLFRNQSDHAKWHADNKTT